MHYFKVFENSESIIFTCVVILPVAKGHGQAAAGSLLSTRLEVKITLKVCPGLAIQKRKMGYQSYRSK